MALTVEDGTIVTDADAYVSVADTDTYNTEYVSSSAWTAATTDAKEVAIRRATQFLDATFHHSWDGDRVLETTSQSLDWPRDRAYYVDGRRIGRTTIPVELKNACMQLSIDALSTPLLQTLDPSSGLRRKRIEVGPITSDKTYSGSLVSHRHYSLAYAIISPLLGAGPGGAYRV